MKPLQDEKLPILFEILVFFLELLLYYKLLLESSLLFLSFLNFSGNDRGFCVSWKRSCGRSFGDYSGLLLTFAPLLCGSQVITGVSSICDFVFIGVQARGHQKFIQSSVNRFISKPCNVTIKKTQHLQLLIPITVNKPKLTPPLRSNDWPTRE